MENKRKRTNVVLCDEAHAVKLAHKPSFKSLNEFNPDLFGVCKRNLRLCLDKPIAIGFSILDLSKVHMSDFHYNVMQPHFGDRMKLLMTDTDSLCYKIKSNDINEDFKGMAEHFDYSNLEKPTHCMMKPTRKFSASSRMSSRFIPLKSSSD